MANSTLYFQPINEKEDWLKEELPIVASTAFVENAAIAFNGDGTCIKCTGSTVNFAGILGEPIASTDADYATAYKKKFVYTPRTKAARARFTVGAGTFSAADVGKSVVFHDEKGLAVDTGGIQARIVQYIDANTGICEFNQDIVGN